MSVEDLAALFGADKLYAHYGDPFATNMPPDKVILRLENYPAAGHRFKVLLQLNDPLPGLCRIDLELARQQVEQNLVPVAYDRVSRSLRALYGPPVSTKGDITKGVAEGVWRTADSALRLTGNGVDPEIEVQEFYSDMEAAARALREAGYIAKTNNERSREEKQESMRRMDEAIRKHFGGYEDNYLRLTYTFVDALGAEL